MNRLLLAPLLFLLTEISFAKDKLNYTVTSDSQIKHHGLGKEYSVKLNALAKDQRKTPKKYLEDILDYYYGYV